MKKFLIIFFSAVALVTIGKTALWLSDNKIPNFTREVELYVYPETTPSEVIDMIGDAVKRPGSLSRTFREKDVAAYIQPGHYVVTPSHTSVYVARMLNNCWQTPVKLVLSGTLRLRSEIARKISSQMMVDSATVRAAFEDKALLSEFGFTPETVFALLVPDTYQVWWTDSMRDILARQKKAYDAFWTDGNIAKARSLGLSKLQVSIIASIVSGESNYQPEFPKIAGVYLNRYKKGMKLQADPTVAFCYDYTLNRIFKSHLKIDSPYNTYLHEGLPPGPIYVPTKATLEAVLNPDYGGGNLFFCADPSFNGSHRFARTYSEHLANARAFQKALNQRAAARKG